MGDDERGGDGIVIVCSPYSFAQFMELPGNAIVQCDGCDEPIVISTEGQKFALEKTAAGDDVHVVCQDCARARYTDERVSVVPGAIERLQREGFPGSIWTRRAMKGAKTVGDVFRQP